MTSEHKVKWLRCEGWEEDTFVNTDHLVTSVRIDFAPGHEYVTIFNRGGNAGTITVNKGDGEMIARRLLNEES